MKRYLVAASRPWHREFFAERIGELPGLWKYVSTEAALTRDLVAEVRPRYIFFPHWSHLVPAGILAEAECVCFHMTDLPYGRGGSPLQNLIVRKHGATKLTALRMVEELDAGPIYAKRSLSLEGSAGEIYRRAAALTWDMIADMVEREPEPVPQTGPATRFQRRKPEDGNLAQAREIEQVYDHIRMVDAEGYPPAFLRQGEFTYEFSGASLSEGEVRARVVIRKTGKQE